MLNNLKARRIENGMTQKQLAEKSGVLQGYISALESGARKSASIGTIMKLARALDCDIKELLPGDADENDARA